MIGYAQNWYRLWNPRTEKIIIPRDVKFDETKIKYEAKNEDIEQTEQRSHNFWTIMNFTQQIV